MALTENLTPLMVTKNATYKTVEGVTYFKLKSEFEGDYTKHCGLLGEEIDENFYFLRGYDIDNITIDEKRNLIITRIDKDYAPIVVNIGEKLGQTEFKFNKDNGIITVIYPDGTTSTMEGFLVEGKDIRIATDMTLDGNGTMYNPLRISPIETTGTLAPANEYFDITNGSNMPEGKGKGYRVVTKEKIDNFGCLYPFSAVKKIQDKLTETGSQWRVPTKEDWDELLNAFECKENRNHNSKKNSWLGNSAGRALKSFNLWIKHEILPTETPTYGEDIAGLSIYPLGIGPDRNEILDDDNSDIEGFGKIVGMWANTLVDDGNAYVKLFGYNSGKVDQDTYGEGSRMSIRLVKDYTYSNFNEIENILGFPYPTELVYGPYEDCPYAKIWTKINFYSDAETLDGIRSNEWSAVTDSDRGVEIVYFINEWDGTEWRKKPMKNGDSVVIIDREGKPYHEWRIIDGELIDTTEALVEEFKKDFTEVREDIAELSATTKELVQFYGSVVEAVNEFSASTVAEIERLDGRVDVFSAATVDFSASTVAEIERLDDADETLGEAIETEHSERIAADAVLNTQIEENIAKIIPVTENLEANVLEEYVLKNTKGEELGSHIKIYKDSALVGAEINYKGATSVSQKEDGTFEFTYSADVDKDYEYLYLIYRNENSGLSLVGIDFEKFLMETEEGFGIKIVDHKININIKSDEKYLTVSEKGLQTINIDETIETAVDALTAIDEYISGLTTEFSASTVSEIARLDEKINAETDRSVSKDVEIDAEIKNIKDFNNTLNDKVDAEIAKKVNDVFYDRGNSVIKLKFADGSYSEGFDSSEFVIDGMLDKVSFDNNTNEIKFVWNTAAGNTEFIVPLDKFVDQYSVADDSISFLKISDDNKVSAIVDGGNGFSNTLATTDFVKDSVNEGVNTVREEITNYIDAQDEVISNKIDVLNGDTNTVGSVSYTVKKKFNDAILTDGAPITSTSIEEANKVHSLVRKIDVNGEYIYFVSSDASDMYYESKSGEVKLSDYITSMENRIKELENRLDNLGNDIDSTIKNIIKSYIVGTENEIKVVENEDKLKIGFDDNAIFGEI